jgi:hypothetical protein
MQEKGDKCTKQIQKWRNSCERTTSAWRREKGED